MIGNGHNRQVDEIYWDSSWGETTPPGSNSGYKSDTSGTTKRWGTNTKEFSELQLSSGAYGTTDVFYTEFDDAVTDEAQGAICHPEQPP